MKCCVPGCKQRSKKGTFPVRNDNEIYIESMSIIISDWIISFQERIFILNVSIPVHVLTI